MMIDRFVTVLADTKIAADIHYRLRYHVFCHETRFEDPARFPDRREMDTYDTSADHFLVWDRLDENWVGAMRLINADGGRFPLEAICTSPVQELDANRFNSVEFSRLCILHSHRRIQTATTPRTIHPARVGTHRQKQQLLHQRRNEVLLRLLFASFGRGQDQGLSYCYSIVTAALARILVRFGIPLQQVGQEISHRGIRIPHRYHVNEAIEGMMSTLPEFANMVANSPAYVPFSEIATDLPTNLSVGIPGPHQKQAPQPVLISEPLERRTPHPLHGVNHDPNAHRPRRISPA